MIIESPAKRKARERADAYINSVMEVIRKMERGPFRDDMTRSLHLFKTGKNRMRLFYLLMLKKYPVGIREFVTSKQYLNMEETIYESVLRRLERLNNPLMEDGSRDPLGLRFYEAVMTGGIGTAKTTQALITIAYQIYVLSCFRDPHKVLGQDASAEILFIFQSLNSKVAKDVDYKRFRAMMERSPYFCSAFPFRKDIESRLVFPHRIEVTPVTGDVTATIGQNVFGGMIDEVNFMAVVQGSKKKMDNSQYDQAQELYNSIASRRESRFMQQGITPGILCLCSSKNYPGQFTDVKQEESLTDKGIFYQDDVVWNIKPKNEFTGHWFYVFAGDASHKPRILQKGEKISPDYKHLVHRIPVEFRKRFDADIYNALREVAGVATLAKSPYIPNVDAIQKMFSDTAISIFSREECDFVETNLKVFPKLFRNLHQPRYVHVDLAKTGDCCGVAIGHVAQFVDVETVDGDWIKMPQIHMDGCLRVMPPKNDEIYFHKIRGIILVLRQLGLPIKWVSYDSWQSTDSIQILRQKGFVTGELSMDRTTVPYDITKTAICDGRVLCPYDEHLQTELVQLERTEKGKVDHPPNGFKDVADALAGVVYGLTSRREIWLNHGVPVVQDIVDKMTLARIQEQAEFGQ